MNDVVAIEIDRSGDTPVYVQIAGRIRDAIAAGRLAPGRALPPVRAVAADLGVNLNTVARAYRMLEEEGFVTIHGRSRAEVAAPAAQPDVSTKDTLTTQLHEILARLRQAGVQPPQLRRLIERELRSLGE